MRPTPEQVAKLPVWAQNHIEYLIRDRERAESLLEMEKTRPESPFKYNDDKRWDKWHNLPENHSIRVVLKDGSYVDVRVEDEYCGEPAIYLMANRGIRIQPSSHNTVYIIPEKV